MNARVSEAWAAGVRPHYKKDTDRWIIRVGDTYAPLSVGSDLTAVGEHARTLGWDEPDLRMDMFQAPEVRGQKEYLRLRSGQRVVGREWKNGRWHYKPRGRDYYTRRAQFNVQIPCFVRGVGERPFETDKTFFFIVTESVLPGLARQFVTNPAGVKDFVMRNLTVREESGELLIWEGSDTQWVLSEDEEWRLSEMESDPVSGQTVVTLNVPLRGVPMLWGHLKYPEHILDECFQDTDGRCVFVALAKFMELPEGVVEGELHEIFESMHTPEEREAEPWCGRYFAEVGVTAAMLIRYAQKHDMGVRGALRVHGVSSHKCQANLREPSQKMPGVRFLVGALLHLRGRAPFP